MTKKKITEETQETQETQPLTQAEIDAQEINKYLGYLMNELSYIPMLKFPHIIQDREQMLIYLRMQYKQWIDEKIKPAIDDLMFVVKEVIEDD